MAIILGSARVDERGKYKDGKAGDQKQTSSTNDKKGEVSMQPYYTHSKGWYGFRFKNAEHARKMAQAMRQACNNEFIGYDQNDRLDIMDALEKYGSMAKIAEPTECDCSSLVRACIYQATGVKLPVFYTVSQPKVLADSGLFYGKMRVTASTILYDGDILVTRTKGHTVAVCSGRERTTGTKKEEDTGINMKVLEWQKSAVKDGFTFPECGIDGEWGDECKAVAKKAICKMRFAGGKAVYKYKNLTKIVQKAVGVKEDGMFGTKTDKAVIEYQKEHGLKADGDVGLDTWKKILGV